MRRDRTSAGATQYRYRKMTMKSIHSTGLSIVDSLESRERHCSKQANMPNIPLIAPCRSSLSETVPHFHFCNKTSHRERRRRLRQQQIVPTPAIRA